MTKSLRLFAVLFLLSHASFSQLVPCIGTQSLTATPPPNAAGAYAPGTVVTYCYSVTDYAQSVADWIAGIHPTFGPGWDLTTLIPISASPSCDGQGNWAWYTSCTGTASGITYGPGFYYDTPAGGPGLDGIPGNNFGDNCQAFTWNFCFQVTVSATAPQLADLTVCVQALSDYQAGSWGNDGCSDACESIEAFVQVCTLIIPSAVVTNASCANSNDGSIVVTPSGLPPYSFLWSNGATTGTLSNVPPGIYTLTVTDSADCDKVVTFQVGGPQPINLNATVVQDGCVPGGGSVTLAPTGGTGGSFTYLWSDGTTSNSLTNLTGGTYTVTVTDANSCTETQTFTITSVAPVSVTASSTNSTCTGNNGSATATVSGGTAPFVYSWSPSGGNGAIASNLGPGTYTVLITDANGCTSSAQTVVQAIGSFTLASTFVPLACDPQGTTSATVTVTGGTAPYTYQWTPTGGTAATATGLTSGTYVVYVTDANSCVDSNTIVIPGVIPVTLNTSATSVQCNVPNSGSVIVTATGGVSPYTYLWSDGSTSASVTGLAGGLYTVTVTDANGCTSDATSLVNVIPDVFVTAGSDQTVCAGQPATITASATGGTSPFGYTWNNGPTTDSQTVNPIVTTIYTVTVIDANSCTATSFVTVNVEQYPVVSVSSNASICYGASTQLTASGGSTFSWSPVDGLSDPAISNPVASPLTTTPYTVTVSNGLCSSTGNVIVTVEPEIQTAFSPDTTQGEAPLEVTFTNTTSGASTYLWDFGDGNISNAVSPTNTYTEQGSYTVTMVATNTLGCTDTLKFTYIVVNEYAALVIPNVFTPNGDGKNDEFSFIETGISSISVNIFNRWGNEIYSWNAKEKGWNGKSKDGSEAPDGVYFYVIKARGIDDKPYNYQGTVQLIRVK
ncbi:MAG: gliding motility-associated C-terminal domain-containing protein [Bacteroidetes bacterium]|nr:gliding motility-associated C-terminal domain-containing protein [Bacteroidota bacterium]